MLKYGYVFMVYNSISVFIFQDKIINPEQIALIIYSIIAMALLVTMFILFFTTFQKRKNKLLLDKIAKQREFEEELVKTQTEIQEQTLKNVGQELHDNVGQLLAFANMQLNLVSSLVADGIKGKVEDTKAVVNDAIQEVRALSKTLNSEVILSLGFQESINTELQRLNKMDVLKAELLSSGDRSVCRNNQDAIILFRIIQEFISNTVKYSQATQLTVTLRYTLDNLYIEAEDNGIGFDFYTVEKGSGLINMQSRADLTDSDFSLTSKSNEGTKLTLNYPITLRALS
jgi:signal transduction histidine kinase